MSNPKSFNALQAHWYELLKNEGFEDIENQYRGDCNLKIWDSFHFVAEHDPQSFRARQHYFYIASHFLESTRFKEISPRYQEIWKLHSQGLSYRAISAHMGSLGRKHNKDQIQGIIEDLKKVMFESLESE